MRERERDVGRREIERNDNARIAHAGNALFLGAARRIGFPFAARRAMPVVLARAESAVVALVHGQTARVLVHQILHQFQIVAPLHRRVQQLRLQQLVQTEQRRIAPHFIAHQLIGRFGALLLENAA